MDIFLFFRLVVALQKEKKSLHFSIRRAWCRGKRNFDINIQKWNDSSLTGPFIKPVDPLIIYLHELETFF